MRTLAQYIESFAIHFFPTKAEGDKLIDEKSGFSLSYSVSLEASDMNLIASFGYKNRVIQRWGCAGNRTDERHFIQFYNLKKSKMIDQFHLDEQNAHDEAIKKLKW